MPLWHLVIGVVGLRVIWIWGGVEVWRRQSIIWWNNTPWNNYEGEWSEQFWISDWVLTEADLLQDPTHSIWEMEKGSILYVDGKKPGPCPNGWRGQVV